MLLGHARSRGLVRARWRVCVYVRVRVRVRVRVHVRVYVCAGVSVYSAVATEVSTYTQHALACVYGRARAL